MVEYAKKYEDDPSIADRDELWRLVLADQFVEDANFGRRRPFSGSFCDSSDGTAMSVQLARLCEGRDAEIAKLGGVGLVGFTAGFARSDCRQGVDHTPEK